MKTNSTLFNILAIFAIVYARYFCGDTVIAEWTVNHLIVAFLALIMLSIFVLSNVKITLKK